LYAFATPKHVGCGENIKKYNLAVDDNFILLTKALFSTLQLVKKVSL